MPQFSEYFSLGLSQHQLDFVDISTDYDTPVYVDPYAIEIQDDVWSAEASENIRTFFLEVLNALRSGDKFRAKALMSHMQEPKETFLGVSKGKPKGRGVGGVQAAQIIKAIENSKAFNTGLLSDLSEMALYVDGIDRDKISDLTTNVIRSLLVQYTNEQCQLYDIPVRNYAGPALWDNNRKNWVSRHVSLPHIDMSPIILIPKYIVRRALSLDSQEFYNKQITDFLIAENIRANSSLVQTVKETKEKKVYKKDVRAANPKSKSLIADIVSQNPALLDMYKEIAKQHSHLTTFTFDDDQIEVEDVARAIIAELPNIPAGGGKDADHYHKVIMGALTLLFYPDLIQPRKEWEVHGGRKRIDIVFTNSADTGFFAQRRDDPNTNANVVIVECKNYSSDIANNEIDQLLGRFDGSRGCFGIITCRKIDDLKLVNNRCIDIASRQRGQIIIFTDEDIISMLEAVIDSNPTAIKILLFNKFRVLLE